jgi:hypothetical protein
MLTRRSAIVTGWILLLVSLMVSPVRGQAASALDRILQGLQSPAWDTRAAAAASLGRLLDTDPTQRALPAVQEAVAELLERENGVIRDNFRRDIDTSESFGSYYDREVVATALKLLPETTPAVRPHMLAALVSSAYNPDTQFVKDLALNGEEIVPAVLALAHSDIVPERWNAYALMGHLIHAGNTKTLKSPLAAASASGLPKALRAGLQDPDETCRRAAIDAVVIAGDRDAIPLLALMAQSDPDNASGKRSRFSTRFLAAEAVKKLQQQH